MVGQAEKGIINVAAVTTSCTRIKGGTLLKAEKLFFIYIAKNEEWQRLQHEDWEYVSSMARFYHWWIKRYFDVNIAVEADILPVMTNKLFDRMSLAYLLRDHDYRGKEVFHFYLAYFKPFWTDCQTDGYTTNNFGMVQWKRPNEKTPETARFAFFADENCTKVSHVLSHEILRHKGKKKKEYWEKVHSLWSGHVDKSEHFLYFDSQFKRSTKDNSYRFVTLDAAKL